MNATIETIDLEIKLLAIKSIAQTDEDNSMVSNNRAMQVYKVVEGLRPRLYNIMELNMGAVAANIPVEVVAPLILMAAQKKFILLRILPNLKVFSGKVKDGSSYLDLFKLQAIYLKYIDKVTAFIKI